MKGKKPKGKDRVTKLEKARIIPKRDYSFAGMKERDRNARAKAKAAAPKPKKPAAQVEPKPSKEQRAAAKQAEQPAAPPSPPAATPGPEGTYTTEWGVAVQVPEGGQTYRIIGKAGAYTSHPNANWPGGEHVVVRVTGRSKTSCTIEGVAGPDNSHGKPGAIDKIPTDKWHWIIPNSEAPAQDGVKTADESAA